MATLDEMIALAEKHVENGRRIVAKQRERVESGNSYNIAQARELLEHFERTLAIFESDLKRLLDQRNSN
ncbi:hypothetical protein J6500_10025 [Bradyrhizobium sp. WSM 1704]|uniref:hypothetical protein n=1 Tax=Bradyrhizobium semiaridum TaxID=2821404 RepID=UPI001CE29AB2|nr:hypothetical protein [Bradyrhizobium semiaridum]MCA6122222.1 hypothetical protein [Bradyrhizobium semiaridum]